MFIFVGIGFFLVFGIIPIAQTLTLEEEFEKTAKSRFKCGEQVRCVPADATFLFHFKDEKPVELQISLNFSSKEVFAVDNPINYAIDAKINKTDGMDLLYYVIVSPKENLNYSKYKSAQELIDSAKSHSKLITVTRTADDPLKFHAGSYWTMPIPDDLSFFGIVVKGNQAIPLEKSTPLFTVESYGAKLQADTNRNIERQNFESDITNTRFLGLTVMGIAIVPILLGADILLRISLRESQIDKMTEDKSKYDLDPI